MKIKKFNEMNEAMSSERGSIDLLNKLEKHLIDTRKSDKETMKIIKSLWDSINRDLEYTRLYSDLSEEVYNEWIKKYDEYGIGELIIKHFGFEND